MVAALLSSCFWALCLLYSAGFHLVACLNQEGLALLSFKASITDDPDGSLSDWNASDPNPCAWNGISCRDGGVVSISIPRRKLTGSLNPALGALPSLRHVNLRSNRLYGSMPLELFRAGGLQSLVLYGNSLSGHIPLQIGNLSYLQILDLSQNTFNGSLPPSLLKCARLRVLYLSHNFFSGVLPIGFGNNLVGLEKLNLSYNQFEGSIPGDIGNLSNLQDTVDFSHNIFSGSIPPSLGNLPEKIYIDLSYNNLSGPIPQNGELVNRGPTAFIGNPRLCGPPLKNLCPTNGLSGELPPNQPGNFPTQEAEGGNRSRVAGRRGLSKGGVVAIVLSDLLGMLAIALLFFYLYRRATTSHVKKQGGISEKGQMGGGKECLCFRKDGLVTPSDNAEQLELVPLDPGVKFNLDELLKASAFVIGKSGIGIVYKVVLEDGLTLAVRRLGEGGSQRFKEFQNEVEAIAKVRHPNIVALRAYYWSIEEKLLVYDYIPNGNLSTAIHGKPGVMEISPPSWPVRLNILMGVAKGLTYLHEFSPKKYVHGDLKPNNILLDDNYVPYISDFGLGRLAHIAGGSPVDQSNRMAPEKAQSQSQSSGALSPVMDIGFYYHAPESLKTLKPSQKWDVYSFGVMLLELITGRIPIVVVGSSEMTLIQWVQLCIDEKKPLSEVLDPYLYQEMEREDEIISVLKIALACVNTNPEKRLSMRHVLESLQRLGSAS